MLSAGIAQAARQLGCRKVITMGLSKGGYAAILHAAMGAKNAGLSYHAIAFGPQTAIYPHNPNVQFPSYNQLIAKSKTDENILQGLKLFGRLPDEFPVQASADVYFSDRNDSDRMEAARLKGPTVRMHPLPMAGHLCHLPFVVDTTNETAVRNLVDRAYAQGKKVGDHVHDDRATYVAELLQMPRMPSVVDLVTEASKLAGTAPRPTSTLGGDQGPDRGRIQKLLRSVYTFATGR